MEYKRPESVLVLICTQQGDVLLMERSSPHGFWQSVTGSLAWHESSQRAAVREVFEETGLQVKGRLKNCACGVTFPIRSLWRRRYARGVWNNREHWFVVMLSGRRTIRLNPKEHRQYRWMHYSHALSKVSSWTNRALIEHVFERSRLGCHRPD